MTKVSKGKLWWSGLSIVVLLIIHLVVKSEEVRRILYIAISLALGLVLLVINWAASPVKDWEEAQQYQLVQDEQIRPKPEDVKIKKEAEKEAERLDLGRLAWVAGQVFKKEMTKVKGTKHV